MLKYFVSKSGKGDYITIQEALDAIPYGEEAHVTIDEGIYREKLFSDKKNLTMEGVGDVLITWGDGAREILSDGIKRGTFRTSTAFFSGERLSLSNITIQNSAGKMAGQAIALYLDVDEASLKGINLYGAQDTFFLAPLPDEERERRGFYGPRCYTQRKRNHTVIEDSYICGTVDFIFGGGDATFSRCEIESLDDGFVTAPSGKKDWDGFLFDSCTFISGVKRREFSYLMRPWRDEGKARFIKCSFGPHINRKGFIAWPGREDKADEALFELIDCTWLD